MPTSVAGMRPLCFCSLRGDPRRRRVLEMSCAHVPSIQTRHCTILPDTFRPSVLNVWLRVLGVEAVDDAIGSVPVVGHEDGRCP